MLELTALQYLQNIFWQPIKSYGWRIRLHKPKIQYRYIQTFQYEFTNKVIQKMERIWFWLNVSIMTTNQNSGSRDIFRRGQNRSWDLSYNTEITKSSNLMWVLIELKLKYKILFIKKKCKEMGRETPKQTPLQQRRSGFIAQSQWRLSCSKVEFQTDDLKITGYYFAQVILFND